MIPLREALNPTAKQLRGFGYVSVLGFGLIGFVAVHQFGASWTVFWVLVAVGVLMLLETIVDAVVETADVLLARTWVYRLLLVIAFPLGFVVSYVLLALVFYFLFTPVALWFRLIGRDKMDRRLDPAAQTYWRQRTAPRAPATYLRMH